MMPIACILIFLLNTVELDCVSEVVIHLELRAKKPQYLTEDGAQCTAFEALIFFLAEFTNQTKIQIF